MSKPSRHYLPYDVTVVGVIAPIVLTTREFGQTKTALGREPNDTFSKTYALELGRYMEHQKSPDVPGFQAVGETTLDDAILHLSCS